MARKRNPIPPSKMPIMQARCKTCPFNADGAIEVRVSVIGRILTEASQTCHSTGAAYGKPDTHLCRGARDFQLNHFHMLGVLAAPTDEAWAAKMAELGISKQE